MLEHVIDKRPQADRLLVAQLTGEARHHAKWRDLTADEETTAVAELRTLAGAHEGEMDEPIARQAAALCRKAGADPDAIPAWIETGRERKANAGRPPFSDPRNRPGRNA